jgi:protein CpxP
MEMKKIILAVIAVAVVALGAVFVIAQRGEAGPGRGGMHRGGGKHGAGMMFRGLDLTDEQKTKLKELCESQKGSIEPLHEAMKANREKLHAATANGAFDEAAVTGIAKEHGDIAAQMLVARQKMKAQAFAILTDEQKAKFAEMQKNRKEHFGGKRGHRRGEKPGTGEKVN